MLRRKVCTGKQGCGLCGGTRGQKGLELIQIPDLRETASDFCQAWVG